MYMIDISVIIPVYNVEKYLKRTIRSVINQSHINIEIILVDDKSTDSSLKICSEYEKLDSRISVLKQEKNQGPTIARNRAISLAKGKYIYFMDSDDYIEKDMLENLYNIADKENLDLVICGYYFETSKLVNNKEEILSNFPINYKSKKYNSQKEFKRDLVKLWDASMLYNIWNKLYRTDIIQNNNIRFKDIMISEDIEFNKEYIDFCNKIYIDELCYYHYIREREGSITTKYKENLFEMRVEEHKEFIKYFNKINLYSNEAEEYVARRYIERAVGCIENLFHSNKNIFELHKSIKEIIYHQYTRDALNKCEIKSKKMKCILIPIKFKLTISTMIVVKMISIVRKTMPDIFQYLKQNR